MTLNDIKNISDGEFINILKKYIPKKTIDEIYNNKLFKYNKKAYIASIIMLGSLLDIISIEILEEVLKEGISFELTSRMLMSSLLLSYAIISSLRKKEFNERKNKFNEYLIDIKTNICNLSDDEFNVLVSSYEYIIDNNLIGDDNINLNVTEVINKLTSINVIDILQEFEIKNNLFEQSSNYEDERNNPDKTYIKGN